MRPNISLNRPRYGRAAWPGGGRALGFHQYLHRTWEREGDALALQHRLPSMAYGRHLAEAGSLLAYGTDSRALCQRSAVFVHKILHGVKPADLPIEQVPSQLVINLKTAQALGLTIPPTVLFQADEVIR